MDAKSHTSAEPSEKNLSPLSENEADTGFHYDSSDAGCSCHEDSTGRRRQGHSSERAGDSESWTTGSSKSTSTRPASAPYTSPNRNNVSMLSPHPPYGIVPSNNARGNTPFESMNSSVGTAMNWISNPCGGMNNFFCMGVGGNPTSGEMMGSNYGPFGMMRTDCNPAASQESRVIRTSNFCLYPPHPKAPPPTTRDKPNGCKTIFVGGLPENTTEEILHEIFGRCGKITTIRMSKKNFCHIRFADELCVDRAIYFSGHRLKIHDKDDALNNGRLHVDYAQARDDEKEYECRQRALRREARHRKRIADELNGPSSPPPIAKYSDHEAAILKKKLYTDETFAKGVSVLVTWMERGECNKGNSYQFLSLVVSAKGYIFTLIDEKNRNKAELAESEAELAKKNEAILLQYEEIMKVFDAACTQKAWDQFTKAQRKNIESMKKMTEKLINEMREELQKKSMDISSDQNEGTERQDHSSTNGIALKQDTKSESEIIIEKLKEENDILRCQLKASENELAIIQLEANIEARRCEKETEDLKQDLQDLEEKLQNHKKLEEADSSKDLHPPKLRRQDTEEVNQVEGTGSRQIANVGMDTSNNVNGLISTPSSIVPMISEAEALLIGLISSFLSVHPLGASIDYICSYLHQIDRTIQVRDVEALMRKYLSVFIEVTTGIGASLEKKWRFCGFVK